MHYTSEKKYIDKNSTCKYFVIGHQFLHTRLLYKLELCCQS